MDQGSGHSYDSGGRAEGRGQRRDKDDQEDHHEPEPAEPSKQHPPPTEHGRLRRPDGGLTGLVTLFRT
ncbi:hypothetical protein [Streptomyces mirabilis]